MSEEMVVWESGLDNKYHVKVVRVPENTSTGRFTITENATGKILNEKNVNLMYGAQFGPDEADVYTWQVMAMMTVDSQSSKP